MKHCDACDRDLELNSFGKNKARYDGLQSQCKECRRAKQSAWFKDNQAVQSARVKANREKFKEAFIEKLWQLLSSSACMDCGLSNPLVLEFDHRDPALKSFNISSAVSGRQTGLDKVLAEIEKCDIVCANCHRMRTQKMFGSWRLEMAGGQGPDEAHNFV